MGKTVFSRSICDEEVDKLDCVEKNFKKAKGIFPEDDIRANTKFMVWSYQCNKAYASSKFAFWEQMKQYFSNAIFASDEMSIT